MGLADCRNYYELKKCVSDCSLCCVLPGRYLPFICTDRLNTDAGNSVEELPETRNSLLMQLRQPENAAAWEEFVELYRPVIYRTARARGLQHADAMDLVQTVLISVAGSIGGWEKRNEQTRFRHWLLRVAKNATINSITRRPPDLPVGGLETEEFLVDRQVSDVESASRIDLEYRRQLYLQAADQVRANVDESTWQAFELTAVHEMSIADTARELGKTVGAVYASRSRIMKQLSDIVSKLEESYR